MQRAGRQVADIERASKKATKTIIAMMSKCFLCVHQMHDTIEHSLLAASFFTVQKSQCSNGITRRIETHPRYRVVLVGGLPTVLHLHASRRGSLNVPRYLLAHRLNVCFVSGEGAGLLLH